MDHIVVKWASEKQHTIVASFEQAWDVQDFALASTEMHHLASSVSHDTSIIVWHRVPPNARMSTKLASIHKGQPPNIRNVFIVPYSWSTGIVLISTWIKIIERIYPSTAKVSMVKSIDEALKAAGESPAVL